ncbi:MAG: FTR1 family protein, partial [Pseudomonadota bacterium]
VQKTGISTKPSHSVDMVSGKNHYEQNCYQCHGAKGLGDGPASGNFDPPPTNFTDNKLQGKGPFHFFNVIQLGIPGTSMPAFNHLSSEEIWNISFYVSELQKGNRSTVTSENQTFLFRAHQALDQSLKAYQRGDFQAARNHAVSAYLDGVEPLEPKLRVKDVKFSSQLEQSLMQIRKQIQNRDSESELAQAFTQAHRLLEQAEKLISHQIPSLWFIFSVSFGIFLREAFEAALLLITLLGVVRSFGNRSAVLAVHGGWSLALLLGILAWFFSGWVLNMTGAQRELLEGSVALFAVFLLLYFGLWMHRKSEIGKWRNFIQEMVLLAKEKRNVFILGSIAFMGVFREVFETVVFLRALLLEAGGYHQLALATGVLTALTLVIVLSWLSVKLSARLPIRQLFMVSSWIMFFLSFIMLGKGIHALQETGLIPISEFEMGPRWDLFGLYPSYQTLGAQLILVIFLLAIRRWDATPFVGRAKGSIN